MPECPNCGKNKKNLLLHARSCDAPAPDGRVAVAEQEEAKQPNGGLPEPRSERGRRRRLAGAGELTPLQEIRWRSPGVHGPWAYYLRPDGATIRDALILYPNGAQLPQSEDERGRYSENAQYYQRRQADKGFQYLGPTLTPDGVRLLIETISRNRNDEILDLEDQIAECQYTIENSDRPEVRDNQRKRREQLRARLERVSRHLNADALSAELTEIARAQRLARVDPKILEVMREMVGEVNERLMTTINQVANRGRSSIGESMGEDPSMHEGKAYIE